MLRISLRRALMLVAAVGLILSVLGNETSLRRSYHSVAANENVVEVLRATQFDFDSSVDRHRVWLHRIVGTPVIVGLRLKIKDASCDLSFLSKCPFLRYLELAGPFEHDLAVGSTLDQVVQHAPKLRELGLPRCTLESFSPLTGLASLQILDLRGTHLVDSTNDRLNSTLDLPGLEAVLVRSTVDFTTEEEVEMLIATIDRIEALIPNCDVLMAEGNIFLTGTMEMSMRDGIGDEPLR